MIRTIWVLLALVWFSLGSAARAGLVANLAADWSNTNNPNSTTFGTWSYRAGTTLLPEVPNWNGNNTTGFTQPAWAPSNTAGDYIPAEFKAQVRRPGPIGRSATLSCTRRTRRTGTRLARPTSSGPVQTRGPLPSRETYGRRQLLPAETMQWSLLVNGVVVSSGTNIDAYDRANPFLFSNGTGGAAVLTQHVTAGSTIDLQITRTTSLGFFVGANLTITEASVPEPSSLVLGGLGIAVFAITAAARRIRKA